MNKCQLSIHIKKFSSATLKTEVSNSGVNLEKKSKKISSSARASNMKEETTRVKRCKFI